MTKGSLLGFFLIIISMPALAHKQSDSYLSLNIQGNIISGQWDVALRDIDNAFPLDDNQDNKITWGELKSHQNKISSYLLKHIEIKSGKNICPLSPIKQLVDYHTDGAYNILFFQANCSHNIRAIDISYTLFSKLDPQHRGLLKIRYNKNVTTAIFGPDKPTQHFSVKSFSKWNALIEYVNEGIHHIWSGIDHILFLLSLLMPAVLIKQQGGWKGVARFKPAFIDTLKIVTAFTLAHSITLSLAVLGIISLPSRLVESGIALTVIFAALNNIVPLISSYRWAMAFAFGLVHGLGFASVLIDLGLPKATLLLALFAFNVGVEIGQFTIVGVFLPLAYFSRNSYFYRKFIMFGGSLGVIVVASIWLLERAFNLKIINF